MQTTGHGGRTFYTVREVAEMLRVDPATIYRAIRDGNFPAIRVRTRYVVPASAVETLASEAMATGRCVDVGSPPIPRPREPSPASWRARADDPGTEVDKTGRAR